MRLLVAVAWGLGAAVPVVSRARAPQARRRARVLVAAPEHHERRSSALPPGPARRFAKAVFDARRERERAAAVRRELPLAVELLRVALGAGMTPVQAIRAVAAVAPPRAGAALERSVRALDLGHAFDAALDDAVRVAPELRPVAEVLAASRRLGSAAGDGLGRVAEELRGEARRAAETRARAVPVRLLFPLVLLVLPAFVLLAVAPAVLAAFAG